MKKLLITLGIIGLMVLPSLTFADTATFYATAGNSTTFDGSTISTQTCLDLSTFRNGAGTSAQTVNATMLYLYLDSRTCTAGKIKDSHKAEMIFDTSGSPIPSSATISSITLSILAGGTSDFWGSSVNIVSFTNASTTAASNADWNLANRGTTSFASSSMASMTEGTQTLTFNNDGISAFTKNGLNKYQFVMSNDLNNDTVRMTTGVEESFWGYTADDGASSRPYLTVTYSTIVPSVPQMQAIWWE